MTVRVCLDGVALVRRSLIAIADCNPALCHLTQFAQVTCIRITAHDVAEYNFQIRNPHYISLEYLETQSTWKDPIEGAASGALCRSSASSRVM